ncbi:hypothetical protein RJ639_016856 [Escallonia herrerae]|uniref:Uncharacterized protein n=1 Tax=Escallonia herrerae TaxID=1293975 RepID=A0AA89AL31_9ASTE|nr:hypothetical protein RJ639_016856 [Escallonia herrerae]
MVCQAASQTRFRALKHENGIAEGSTIIVRVIACFQPLQDCQLKISDISTIAILVIVWLMLNAEDSWLFQQHSSWDSPNLNHMNSVLLSGEQNILPSSANPFSANVAKPGFTSSVFPGVKIGNGMADQGLSQCLPPLMESSLTPPNAYFKGSQFAFPHRLGIDTTPSDVNGRQKRFMIFDQSGNQTRMFFSPFGCSSQIPIVEPTKTVCHLHDGKQSALVERVSPTKPIIQDTLDVRHTTVEKSYMHEDTDEINALLYSDDDEDDDDEFEGEDDEVTSTGHSPFTLKRSSAEYEQVGEISEEVVSSNGSTKRQKLLGSGCIKSLVVDAASSVKLRRSLKYTNDAESSSASDKVQSKDLGSNLGNKRIMKDKINETLRALESIIPVPKSKEPLLIIDDVISYLKSMKVEAKALGISYH